MRVLTGVQETSDYARVSGTPPTPKQSLSAWLEGITKVTGQSIADLTKVTTGAIVKSHSQSIPTTSSSSTPRSATPTSRSSPSC